jgi:TonB family protein
MKKKTGLCSTVLAIAAASLLHMSAAAQNANEAAAWEAIQMSGSADQLNAFLAEFPTGQFAPEARQKYSVVANTMLAPKVQHIDVQFPEDIRSIGRDIGPLRVVKLNILIQQDGRASQVDVVETSGFDRYDEVAKEAARNATYLPAVDHGMAVEAQMPYDVSFGFLCNRAAGDFTCDAGEYPTTCSATVCALLMR